MTTTLPPILVVDDEKNMRLSLEAVMGHEGYQYRAVESAEQALKVLENEEFLHGHHGRAPGRHERLRISGTCSQSLAESAHPDDHRLRDAETRRRSDQSGRHRLSRKTVRARRIASRRRSLRRTPQASPGKC